MRQHRQKGILNVSHKKEPIKSENLILSEIKKKLNFFRNKKKV